MTNSATGHWITEVEMVPAVEMHLRRFFREHAGLHVHVPTGPIETRLPGFRVMVVPPGPRTGLWVYASVGACDIRTQEHGNEFFVLAPEPDPLHVELVTMAAYYHANSDRSYRLGVGHLVPIGRPWLPGSTSDRLLVSTPYPLGPELEHCDDGQGHVQILWLLPITNAERQFYLDNGLEALEQRFEDVGLQYWKADRSSAV